MRTNRGVNTPPRTRLDWDYYTASVQLSESLLIDQLNLFLGTRPERAIARNGYDSAAFLECPHTFERVASVSWGARYENPLFNSSGSSCSRSVPALRALLATTAIPHFVSRADVALDVFESGYRWPDLLDASLTVAKDQGLSCEPRGNVLDPDSGMSVYLGSSRTRKRVIVYEKGKEQGRPDLDWYRIEARIQPGKKGAKAWLGQLSPGEAFADVPAARALADLLALPRNYTPDCPLPVRKARDCDRARDALCRQYLKTIEHWLEELDGDPLALVDAILTRATELQNYSGPRGRSAPNHAAAEKHCE